MVNPSSALGSIGYVSDPDHPAHRYPGVTYAASKATVNTLTAHYAKAFPTMRINVVAPGFAKTDPNGHTGMQSVEEAAEIIVRMTQVGPDGPTGGYFDTADTLPW